MLQGGFRPGGAGSSPAPEGIPPWSDEPGADGIAGLSHPVCALMPARDLISVAVLLGLLVLIWVMDSYYATAGEGLPLLAVAVVLPAAIAVLVLHWRVHEPSGSRPALRGRGIIRP